MAKLAKPVLPGSLYRYRAIPSLPILQRELTAIAQQHLWFSRFEVLNDPMEGFYRPSKELERRGNFQDIVDLVLRVKTRIGICCLSDTKDNELMWTHYAGNHTGICIGYRTQLLLEGLNRNVQLVRLVYDRAPPEVSFGDVGGPSATAIKILSHKKSSWIYEREWRLLHSPTSPPPETETGWLVTVRATGCVSEVYLGSRIPEEFKRVIVSAVAGRRIRVFEMDVSEYEHVWNAVRSPRIGSVRAERTSVLAADRGSTEPPRRRTTARLTRAVVSR